MSSPYKIDILHQVMIGMNEHWFKLLQVGSISEPHLRPACQSHLLHTKNGSLMLSVKHGSQVCYLAQTGFVDFGKEIPFTSGSTYAET